MDFLIVLFLWFIVSIPVAIAGHTTYYDYKSMASAKRTKGFDPENW